MDGKTDFRKIKREYVRGNASLKALSEKYKVPYGTLRKKSAAENWIEARNKKRTKAEQLVIDAAARMEADRFGRILDATDRLLVKVAALIDSPDFETKITDTKSKLALRELSGTLKDIKEIQGVKSERDIEEQKARIESLRRGAGASEGDAVIKVTFGAEGEEFGK